MVFRKTTIIRLDRISDIYKFVDAANKCKFEVYCIRDMFFINGKSIFGVMSLDPSQGMTVEYDSDEVEFSEFLSDYSIDTVE